MSNNTLEIDDTTIIISDLHLSSDICQAKLLDEFLAHIDERCNRLILNGDVFDSLDFNRMKKTHWKILSDLRKLSKKIDLIWCIGNHDFFAEPISHLIGAKVVERYEFLSEGKRTLVIHGHQFDEFLDFHPWLTIIGDTIYRLLQWIDKSHGWARLAKYQSKHYLRCIDTMREKAINLARKLKYDIIVCGHSHTEEAFIKEEIIYINCGCWTENPPHFAQIQNGFAQVIPYGPC